MGHWRQFVPRSAISSNEICESNVAGYVRARPRPNRIEMVHETPSTELAREKHKRRHEGETAEDPSWSPKNPKTAGGGAGLTGPGARRKSEERARANHDDVERPERCSTPPAECAPASPPTHRPPLGRAPASPPPSSNPARCTSECGKPETPYHPICLGFFGRESPIPDRPLAQTAFPKCLSPVLRRPPVSLASWRRQIVEQEQAELMEMFREAESEGAVALTGTSMLFPRADI